MGASWTSVSGPLECETDNAQCLRDVRTRGVGPSLEGGTRHSPSKESMGKRYEGGGGWRDGELDDQE